MRDITNIHINKLINDLKKKGIAFYFDKETTIGSNGIERRLENVIFEKNGKEYKIYEGFFFRDFGQDINPKSFYEFQEINILNFFRN